METRFLLAQGIPLDVLRGAARLARDTGVSATRVLLARGLVSEDEFYRALARQLGARFEARPTLGAGTRFPAALLAGLAPGAGAGRLVAAPGDADLPRLLARPRGASALTITTPAGLRAAVFARLPERIAGLAAHALPNARPDLSIRDGLTSGQIVGLAALAGGSSFSLGLAPETSGGLLLALVSTLYLGMIALRCATAALPDRSADQPPCMPDASLPTYTILVALHREEAIVGHLVAALRAIDYPPEKLDIKFVLEAHDAATRTALDGLAVSDWAEIVIAPPGEPRTKPRALNVALPLARGRHLVVYDGEDVPDRDQLRLAAAAFAAADPRVACLQARLAIDNTHDSWLTRFFTVEYAALFDVINPGLARLGLPLPLGGTSNHFRTDALRDLGGWDAWNVTEDADLGIRLARHGYRTADLPSTTHEEAPSTLPEWLRQRTRWMKGFMQTTCTHSRHPLDALGQLGPIGFAVAVMMTFGTVVSALGYPFFTVLSLLAVGEGGSPWALGFFACGLAAMLLPAGVALRRRRIAELWPQALGLPLYYLLVSLAAWCALLELVRNPFRWNKTPHGRARTSRRQGARNGP